MTTKHQVDLTTYEKNIRQLQCSMEKDLAPEGSLYPILHAVTQDVRLRFDIRDNRFSIYYRGGSILRVDGRKSPPALSFDKNYFHRKYVKIDTPKMPNLPKQFMKPEDIKEWVQAFPDLMNGMNGWWDRMAKSGRTRDHERSHCQAMAAANSGRLSLPTSDYFVLDLEYQWAQRRFDMIAAMRNPSIEDPIGWVEPVLVFIEVKSDYGAVSGKASIVEHARDYRDIVSVPGERGVKSIKSEFQKLISQKKRLGLIHNSLPFQSFSAAVTELLIVFVGLEPKDARLRKPLTEVKVVSEKFGPDSRIRFMKLSPADYQMSIDNAVSFDKLIDIN